MATQVQFRGGTTNEHSSFNGVLREVTVDTDKKTLVVQDGSTNGGFPLLRQDLDNLPAGTIATADIADLGVTTGKIADLGVTTGKIAADAVTEAKIANDAVGAEHIEDLDGDVKWLDTKRAVFGTDNDCKIHFNGTKTWIDVFTGDFGIAVSNASDHSADFIAGGGVKLYYDGGSNPKFETTSGGATVTGTLTTTSGINAGSNISMNDGVYIKCGTHDDLQFFHSTNSYISNTTDTDLIIRNLGNAALEIKTQNSHAVGIKTNDEYSILCNPNAGVNIYHDGTKTFETFSKGVVVRGKAGDDGELQLYADGGTANADCWMLKAESGAAEFDIANYADGAWETNIRFNANNSTNLYYDGTAKFWTTTSGVKIPVSTSGHGPEISSTGDVYPQITLGANRASENNSLGYTVARWNGTDVAAIDFVAGPDTTNKDDGKIGFNTRPSGGGMERRMTIDDTGSVLIGTTTSHSGKFVVKDTDNSGNQVWIIGRANGNTGSISFRNNGDDAYVGRIQAGTTSGMEFQTAGSTRGSFDTNGDFIVNDGNFKILTAGHGIDFSQQTATSETGAAQGNAPAEVLDHYEEGTWTPVLGGTTNNGTYNVSGSGHYTRIGRLVFVALRFNGVDLDNNAAGDVIITGLPFSNHANASSPNTNNMFGGLAEYNTTFNENDMHDWYPGNTYIYSLSSDTGTNWYSRSVEHFEAGTMYINLAGWYITS